MAERANKEVTGDQYPPTLLAPSSGGKMNGKWLSVVLFLVGLIVGGGGSAAIGSSRYSALEKEVNSMKVRYETTLARLDENVKQILRDIKELKDAR